MYKSWTLVQVLLYTWAFFYVCMAYAYLMYIRIHVRYTGDREVTAVYMYTRVCMYIRDTYTVYVYTYTCALHRGQGSDGRAGAALQQSISDRSRKYK